MRGHEETTRGVDQEVRETWNHRLESHEQDDMNFNYGKVTTNWMI